ncbi:MAG: S8 family serine peptidase, partial [Clostridiales bacterium]|jgi:hypothetical protein|nr:S8 family serine peptidase [Clostridiales bacterium]
MPLQAQEAQSEAQEPEVSMGTFLLDAATLVSETWRTDYAGMITMTVGDPVMDVNGTKKEVDPGKGTAPALIGGRVFVPVRAVAEEAGGEVRYDPASREIYIKADEYEVRMTIGEKTLYANGTAVASDAAPEIINERTMVPVRVLSENMGFEVNWNAKSQSVYLTRDFQTMRLIVKTGTAQALPPLTGVALDKIIPGPDNYYILQFYSMLGAKAAYAQLKDSGVLFCEPDRYFANPSRAVRDSETAQSWGVESMGALEYANSLVQFGDNPVTVAIIGSGANMNHPLLKDKMASGRYNFIQNSVDASDLGWTGTHAAGIIALATQNLPNVKLLPITSLDQNGAGTSLSIGIGILHSMRLSDLVLVTTSAYVGLNQDFITECAKYAIDAGIPVIAPAGDGGSETDLYTPSHLDEAIIATASDQEDNLHPQANTGFTLDLSAPGCLILSSVPEGAYATASGTQVAASHAAAAAALFLANNPDLTPAELSAILQESTVDAGLFGWDKSFGHGVLDLQKKKAFSPEAASIKKKLFNDVQNYRTSVYMSNIVFDERYSFPILTATEEGARQNPGIAGFYGAGRFVVLSHESHFIQDDASVGDASLRENILSWLSEGGTFKRIGIPSTHGETLSVSNFSKETQTWLSNNGIKLANISLAKASLATVDAVILGNPLAAYSETELDQLETYLQEGGSLLILGSGWSWTQRYDDPQCYMMPINILGRTIGYKVEGNVIRDTASIGLAK